MKTNTHPLTVKPLRSNVMLLFITASLWTGIAFGQERVTPDASDVFLNNEIMAAFELRMNGQADSAKNMLESLLDQDSTNALAWFELTRTLHHLGLAYPRKMLEEHHLTIEAAANASKYAPENAYFLSYLGSQKALSLYIDLMTGKEDIAPKLAQVEELYLNVLKLDPSFYEVKITLVELYASLPPDMGGDKAKAESYAVELEQADAFSGAVAREILLGEDVDRIAYWEEKSDLPQTPELYARLCRTNVASGNMDEASSYLGKAVELDSKMNILYLDLARFYLYQAMQNPPTLDSLYPFMELNYMKYLESKPVPNNATRAWAYGGLARLNMRMGDQEKGKAFMEKANALDPFFSKASGVPNQALFVPPDEVVRGHGYYFRPF